MRRIHPKLTMEDAAYCAAAWASGEHQKSLASTYGYKNPVMICLAIRAFLNAYADPAAIEKMGGHGWRTRRIGDLLYDKGIQGNDRKALVQAALQNFRRSLG